MVIYIGNRLRKVFVGIVRTVDERKGVVTHSGQLEGMRETVMHGPDVCERATGIADGKGRTRIASEKEQTRVALLRVILHPCPNVR